MSQHVKLILLLDVEGKEIQPRVIEGRAKVYYALSDAGLLDDDLTKAMGYASDNSGDVTVVEGTEE